MSLYRTPGLLLALCICSVTSFAQSTVKKVLLEEFTTTLCGTCPPKSHEINQFYDTQQSYTVFMTQHAGFGTDSMTNAAASTFASHFQPSTFGFAPAVMIDRNVYPLVDSVPYMSVNGFDTILTTVAGQAAEVSVEITGTYDPATRSLNLNTRTHILNCCMMPGDRNVHVFVVEDSVIGSGFRWDQKCYDSNWANIHYPGQYNAPTSEILQYPHRHVQRAALTGTWGNSSTIPNQPSGIPGTYYDLQLSYTIPANFNASKLKVVAFVANHGPDKFSKQVLNAEEVWVNTFPLPTGIDAIASQGINSVYPNPASDEVTVDISVPETGNATLQIIDVTGRVVLTPEPLQSLSAGRYLTRFQVGELSPGLYIIHLQGDNMRKTARLVVE